MPSFEDFGLPKDLNKSLSKMDYTTPTPIQNQSIPLALDGHDILGSAQTGTGKTAAFSIPLVEAVMRSPEGSALVLTPTRELAKQVLSVIHDLLGHGSPIKTAFIIGGEPYAKQLSQLRAKPRIIVGTPGRVNDHLGRGTLKLNDTKFLVLDETDRMLDMGFGVQLDKIVEFLPKSRQTLMFSATLPQGIVKLSSKYLNNPKRISVGETNVIATNIKQEVVRVEQGEKYQELLTQLYERNGSVIVFVKTKHGADRIARRLRESGFTSEALHGDLRQRKRDKVMKNFRDKNFRVLIATDIAARGLDVPHIEHVVNFDLPQVPEDYIHRMGRTARAGAQGSAVSFVASHEGRVWHAIEFLLDPSKKKSDDSSGNPAARKNKSRRKPYRGRPESNRGRDERNSDRPKNRGAKPNTKRTSTRDDNQGNNTSDKRSSKSKHFKRKPDEAKSGKRYNTKNSSENRSQKSSDHSEKKFDKKKRPNKDSKKSGKKFGAASKRTKVNGNAPMKKRSNNKLRKAS